MVLMSGNEVRSIEPGRHGESLHVNRWSDSTPRLWRLPRAAGCRVGGEEPVDGLGVDLGNAHERNRGSRDDDGRKANRYLKRIHYGNRTSLLDPFTGQRPRILTQAQIDGAGWMFEVVYTPLREKNP